MPKDGDLISQEPPRRVRFTAGRIVRNSAFVSRQELHIPTAERASEAKWGHVESQPVLASDDVPGRAIVGLDEVETMGHTGDRRKSNAITFSGRRHIGPVPLQAAVPATAKRYCITFPRIK